MDSDPNDLTWDFSQLTGLQFEAEIQRIVRQGARPDGRGVWVVDTPRTGDRGKDIVVHFKRDITILGLTFNPPRTAESGTLYIECKKNDGNTLSPGDFGGSLLQLSAEGRVPDYFLLVTNSTLTPELQHNSRERFRANGSAFYLIDRRRLAMAVQGITSSLPTLETIPPAPAITASYSCFDRDSLRCLLSSPEDGDGQRGNRKVLEAFVRLDNFSDETRNVRLSLRSDINWSIISQSDSGGGEEKELIFFIPPLETRTARLRLEKTSVEGLDGLRLGLNIDGRSRTLEIRGSKLEFDFDPPLFGIAHHSLVERLRYMVCADLPARFISLRGDAGTGKSKILEALSDTLKGSDCYIKRVELRPSQLGKTLRHIVDDLANVNNCEPPSTSPTIAEFFEFLDQVGDHYAHYVICLEDLHHGSPDLLAALRSFGDRTSASRVTIIGTGRVDGTFPNDDYFALLDHIAIAASAPPGDHPPTVADLAVTRWTDDECCSFIRATVTEAPETVVASIHRISENTPFGAIQAIEYLLDLKIAQVVNRNTVGITNASVFSGKQYIPQGLHELIQRRCNHLVASSNAQARVLLVALAALGMQIPSQDVRKLVQSGDDDRALMAAEKHKFVEVRDGQLRFTHENLQTYFLNRLGTTADGAEAAEKLLTTGEIVSGQRQRGRLAIFAGRPQEAFAYLQPLWRQGTGWSNISSLNIPASELPYFQPLIAAAEKLEEPDDAIARLCVAETYCALHNASLAIALKTVRSQYAILGRLKLSKNQRDGFMLELRQLEAHILLNLGHVPSAQKIMLEIVVQASHAPEISGNHRLMFDVYDRLQNIHHQLNHRAQFVNFSELSRREAESLKDDKLASLVKSSRTKEHAFDDPEKFLFLTEQATEWSRRHASPRHVCHANLNLSIAKMMAMPTERERIGLEIGVLGTLLGEAVKNAYSFSITRAELALATAYALLGLDKAENRRAAERYARLGIESCLRYGNGFFFWQLHNLLAITELHESDSNLGRAFGHWQTALHYLDQQGLLFLGNLDSCSPNLAVLSNLIRFRLESEGERGAEAVVKHLRSYDSGQLTPAEWFQTVLRSVLDHGLIGRSKPLPIPFREPVSNYLLALR
ncbi:AAA family ATPase [Magnetospirillum sulfuroxidans]|uniref:ORC1/DEAH AAA+ ATPase domain-containing protein n=1 Tax=Magnetospirillum sulfuroxidans TaxID=611300 RepID=A0ABS5IHN2_9PROT|nr:AAA family ATPase [Magnetospirillum sulfuroxidans]MBR9973890.1 hypothetical protein [Magnetospirillum sulfuroxidans]